MTPHALARVLYDAILAAVPAEVRIHIEVEREELLGMLGGALEYLLTAPPAHLVGPVLALVQALVEWVQGRRVEVTAGAGVVPTVDISG